MGGETHHRGSPGLLGKGTGVEEAGCRSCNLRKLPGDLWTQRDSGSSRHASQASAVSISTAQWTAILPNHIKGRMFTRDIDKEELQRARKHGVRVPLSGCKLAWLHEGLTYITDATGRVGVTTWRATV